MPFRNRGYLVEVVVCRVDQRELDVDRLCAIGGKSAGIIKNAHPGTD